ncbi:hypothetical protein LUZ63_021260 [Rhynchospora breviuscula]|uniref:glucose-6-phosphate dehydrogenase (NADP(+)) n=1 Tax=Rhynchospora breviuscula TaxID=2022672 RepID=A0A9P9Z6X4_9POAL|nr:hypothetical protein LUZ63_021260 [Rhynchospora breviuscula]
MVVEISPGHNPLRDPEDRRLNRIAGPSALVIFGVTGDLSRKKLMPAVYDLANRGLLPPGFALVGFARRDWEDQDFAKVVHESVQKYARTEFREETWQELLEGIRFVQGEFDDPEAFQRLRETVDKLDTERGTMGNHAYYLSIPPKAFPLVTTQLKASGLVGEGDQKTSGWRRVVIEKPFGHDLASARELNEVVEERVPRRLDLPYRPLPRQGDGAEHPRAALRQRAVRADLEPQLRRSRPDHDGGRHRRRRSRGLLRRDRRRPRRHPEPPPAAARADRDGGAHQLQRRRPPRREGEGPRGGATAREPRRGDRTRSVRRRVAGRREGARLPRRRRDEPRVGHRDVRGDQARDQHAPLVGRAVLRAQRQASRAPCHRGRGRVQRAPQQLFSRSQTQELGQNALVIRVQPDEGVTIRFGSKVPGDGTQVRDVTMDFGYGHAFTEASPEAYERLILDVLLGDPPLFPRHEEVELSWKILDPIEEFWAAEGGPLEQYSPGSWGPASADELLARDGRTWRRPGHRGRERRLPRASDARDRRPVRRRRRRAAPGRPDPRGRRRRRERGHRPARPWRGGLERREPGHRTPAARRPRRGVVARPGARRPLALGDRSDRAAPDHGCLVAGRSDRVGRAPRGALRPGDTDFAWTRVTRWREQLAAVLDQPPYEPVTAIEVAGSSDSPSTALLAGWLGLKLQAPVVYRYLPADEWAGGIKSVRLTRASGDTLLERPIPGVAVLTQPGQPTHELAFPRRTMRECLAEELRRLDPDVLYGPRPHRVHAAAEHARRRGRPMTENGSAKRVIIKRDADTLADYVAARLVNRILKRVAEGKRMHICLTGGTMGGAVLRSAARDPRMSEIDWSLVHFWFGDERFVARDSDDRNDKQAREALLDGLDVPAENVHEVASTDDGLDLDAAAIAYADELAQFAPSDRSDTGPWPSFDICFLGVGPDAHIASLFPDRPEIS